MELYMMVGSGLAWTKNCTYVVEIYSFFIGKNVWVSDKIE